MQVTVTIPDGLNATHARSLVDDPGWDAALIEDMLQRYKRRYEDADAKDLLARRNALPPAERDDVDRKLGLKP